MADYIDRQAAIDALDSLCDGACAYSKKQRDVMCSACPLGDAFDVIGRLSAADVVEVVRCKDCRYWKTEHPKANGYHCCYRIHNAFPMHEDDFCSRGERREK